MQRIDMSSTDLKPRWAATKQYPRALAIRSRVTSESTAQVDKGVRDSFPPGSTVGVNQTQLHARECVLIDSLTLQVVYCNAMQTVLSQRFCSVLLFLFCMQLWLKGLAL